MDKKRAQLKMSQGFKVKHTSFDEDEYLYMRNGEIYKNGINYSFYWNNDNDKNLENGWNICGEIKR